MRTTKRTIVLDAKLVEKFLRIAVCPGYCDRTGRGSAKQFRLSSAAGGEEVPQHSPRRACCFSQAHSHSSALSSGVYAGKRYTRRRGRCSAKAARVRRER